MGTTSEKLTYLNETKSQLKETINFAGGTLTNEPFRQYPEKLYDKYLDILKDNGEELFEGLPKDLGSGTSISMNNTANTRMKMSLAPSELSQSGTPTPDNPQTIHTISGNNAITIKNKNVLDLTKATYIDGSNIAPTILTSNSIQFYMTTSSTTYAYKRYRLDLPIDNYKGKTLYIKFNSTNTNSRIYFRLIDSEYNPVSELSRDQIIIPSDTSASYISLVFYPTYSQSGQQGTTVVYSNVIVSTLNEGYVPNQEQTLPLNLGDIEYCKIGTYTDEFYLATESDTSLVAGKWYLKKNIGKVVFDGSENWVRYSALDTTNNNCYYISINNLYIDSTGATKLCLSNNFAGVSFNNKGTDTQNMWVSKFAKQLYLKIQNSITTTTELQTWLSTHNTIVYYVLDASSYTLLNDTLQEQLTNIYNKALSYQDQTNISQVNDDLPFVISANVVQKYFLNDEPE